MCVSWRKNKDERGTQILMLMTMVIIALVKVYMQHEREYLCSPCTQWVILFNCLCLIILCVIFVYHENNLFFWDINCQNIQQILYQFDHYLITVWMDYLVNSGSEYWKNVRPRNLGPQKLSVWRQKQKEYVRFWPKKLTHWVCFCGLKLELWAKETFSEKVK